MIRQRQQYSFLLLLFVSGCALSPQLVNIHPQLEVEPAGPEAAGTAIALAVTDERQDNILGRRGGVYSETATLTTSGDITGPLRQSLAGALSEKGYRLTGNDSAPVLRVAVTEISYADEKNRVTRNIRTRASINAAFRRGNRTYTNTYTATRTREMLTAPTASENERLINETLAATLQQLLNDAELFGLIDAGR